MGNSYVGVVNDETAFLTNPAGLGKVRDFTLNLFNPQLEGSFGLTDAFNANNYQQATDAQGILDALNKTKGTPYHAKAQLFPSIVLPNFGVGALAKYQYDAYVDPITDKYSLDYTADWAAAVGYNLRFFGGIVKLGVTARVVDRTEVHVSLPATSTNLNFSSLKREGMGVASDVGLIVTAPTAWLPSLSAVARDVGGTSYNLSPGMYGATTYRPADTPSRIDAAFSVFPLLGKSTRATITVEAHDVMTIGDEPDQMKRVHAGFEINFSDFFFLRGGLNQRYWTGGVEFATRFFQLQAASYGEEVGTAAANVEDRRWVGSFAIRF